MECQYFFKVRTWPNLKGFVNIYTRYSKGEEFITVKLGINSSDSFYTYYPLLISKSIILHHTCTGAPMS